MKLADISIKRPVFATVMVAVLAVFGIAAYPKIGVDLFPDVEFPIVTITAVYPGADPETVESKVSDKLEEAVSSIAGIKVLRSTSVENVALVVIQFVLERKADQATQDVRDKIAAVLKELPADLEPPIVEKLDFGSAPILVLSLSGPVDTRELTRLADDVVKARLQSITGVGGVTLVGGQEREFHVWVDPQRMEAYGISVGDVVQALGTQNVDIPGGRLDLGEQEFVVKTRGNVSSAEEIRRIILPSAGGAPVRIGDIAAVEDGREELRSYSSLNGQSAVALIVRKQSGANTVEIAHKVKAMLPALAAQLPKGVKLGVPTDNSTFIEHAINDVQFDLAFGALLAVLIIMVFLRDWRATFISALAIPASVIATFGFIQMMGFTFNNMTMLALSLSIGILVDDAIVVIENIHRHLEMGKSPMQAARDGTAEIGLAVLATTASIVAVFVPVATMKGIIGRFFLQFGLTVAFAVLVSLFVAFTLTPMASSRLLRVDHHKQPGRISQAIERFLLGIETTYQRLLTLAMRRPWTTIGIAVLSLLANGFIIKFVPGEFLPPEDRGIFMVKADLPTGTGLGQTTRVAEEVAAQLRKVPGVDSTLITIGGGSEGEVNKADLQVNLVGRKQRSFTQTESMDYIRKVLAGRTDATFAVEQIQAVGGGGAFRAAAIQYNIRGSDYEELNKAAGVLIAEMKKSGGYVDLDTTYRGGKPEVRVTIDRDAAADLGVPIAAIATTIRSFIAGEKATEIQTDGERFDVRVRLPDDQRRNIKNIETLKVRSATGVLVPLSSVVSVETGTGPARIERQNRQRQVTVFANLEGKALGSAVSEIEKTRADKLPKNLTTDWAGMGDVMIESFGYMIAALLLAIIIVYLILAAQFESFLHPFTIMLSLPLSFVGALGALAIARMTLNIFSMIGVIMLMGLVTKNAILLVDYTNTLRAQGMDRTEALLKAGVVRLRPILMTTAAMIFGMIPVALALSEGGEQRAPMAVTVIGGLIASTLLTLVVVPVVYGQLDKLRRTKTPVAEAPGR